MQKKIHVFALPNGNGRSEVWFSFTVYIYEEHELYRKCGKEKYSKKITVVLRSFG